VRVQIDELKSRVGDAEKEFAATQGRLAQERTEVGLDVVVAPTAR